jgi:hypothetical protein
MYMYIKFQSDFVMAMAKLAMATAGHILYANKPALYT